jgi:hypothetical protein
LPLLPNGAYPDQKTPDGSLVFAHLAFHTISMMNFQRFYRYYQDAEAMNYAIDITAFLHWLDTSVYR